MDPTEVFVRELYPQPRDASALPLSVADEYRKARRIRPIDSDLFAVCVRRTLEAICTEQGFPRQGSRDDLYKRLERLAAANVLPQTLTDMAGHIRQLGNLGAHLDDVAVDPEDVVTAADFMEAILEYLYRAPQQVRAVQARLDQRRAAARPTNDS